MRKGYIKYWCDDKGYGFITPDDKGKDVFFHISKWHSKQRPTQGLRVQFDHQIEGNGKLSATEVYKESKKNAQNTQNQRIRSASSQTTNTRKKSKNLLSGIAAVTLLVVGLFNLWPQLKTQIFPQDTPQISTTQQNDTTASITGDINIDRTIALIRQGGPYPYSKDGTTFYNREHLLPTKPVGYYREFTVPTPNADNRGARRIVTGGNPPTIYYYTADHYRSFRKLNIKP